MCGIAGAVGPVGYQADRGDVARMIATLAHRGPDAAGVHVDGCVGLAHARLSIIDVAGGHQPMSTDDGSMWIVFNGEIFNFVELRAHAVSKGCRFRTRSDTEVVLRLFEHEGPAAVRRLNGQWALAIWDARFRTLFLSRDRVGIRPLFYTRAQGALLFASEIKALLAHPGVSRQIDPLGLDNAFTFWSPLPPRTIFRDVQELPPGHSLTWHDGRTTVDRYWRPAFRVDAGPSRSDAERVEEMRGLLTRSTRLRLRADVPVGAYVSGGLDSSIVAALACEVSAAPVETFSIAFDDPVFDESVHQRVVVRALGTVHHELRCSREDVAQAFPDVVWHAEQPLLRTAPVPMFLLSRLVRDSGFKVVLTGEGADEVFGGYDIFKEAKIRRFWARVPSSRRRPLLLRRLYPYLPELRRQPAAYLQAFFHVNAADLASPFFSHLPRWSVTSHLKRLFSDAMRSAIADYDGCGELEVRLPAEYGAWDPLLQAQYLELTLLLPGYLLSAQGDRPAMAHSVEGRFPFLDVDVVDAAASLPPRLKMKVLDEKHLLKLLGRDLVPAAICRRSKQPYRAPDAGVFFGGGGHEYVQDLLSAAQVRRDGIFQPDAVERLVRKCREGRATGTRDTMALVGVLSTQIVIDRFINHFGGTTHGGARAGVAQVHC